MPVDEIKALKAVSHQRLDHVAQHRDQGTRPQGHRAGEAEMMLGHPDRDRRRDERSSGFADASSDDLGADRIGADRTNRPVLLGRAYR